MKKIFIMTMALALLLSMSTFVFANGDEFCGNSNLSCDLDVSATIKPFATVACTKEPVDFDEFCPAPGIYIADGDTDPDHLYGPVMHDFVTGVTNDDQGNSVKASDFTGTQLPATPWSGTCQQAHWDGWGITEVKSNCDVFVELAFDDTGWMNSDTVFAVNRNWGSNPGYFASFDAANSCQWTHTYDLSGVNDANPQEYFVDGALLIEDEAQNEADAYSAKITVTLSMAP